MPVLVKSVSTQNRGWVGVLSTGTFDAHADANYRDKFPLRSIIGAVKLTASTPIMGNPLAFLRQEFGDEYAAFYPRHYAITGQHLWKFDAALTLTRPRPFTGALPRVWARTPMRLRGELVSLTD